MKQNIIFLTVDAVLFNSLFDSDNKISSSPFINSLSKKSIVFENFFSNGGTTQFSLPSFFTSSYPLDYGGYDDGIKYRPESFVETLKQNQYKTIGIYNGISGSSLHDYNRGFDEFIDLYPPIKFAQFLSKDFISYYKKENLNFNDSYVFNRLESKIKKTLKWYRNTVHNTEHKIAFHDYKYLERKVKDEIKEMETKKNHYIHSVYQNSKHDKFNNRYKLLFKKSVTKFKLIRSKIKHIFIISIFFVKKIFILKSFNIDFKNNLHFLRKNNSFIFSGNQVFKNAIHLIEKYTKKDRDKPFFLWMHLMDHHELNYHDSEYKINSSSFSNYKKLSEFYCLLKKQKITQKDIILHMSLFYCDLQINSFFNYLEKKNIFENTLLILTADHGNRRWSRYDFRPKNTEGSDSFFDELYHIPLLFYSKNIKAGNSKQLSSSIDLAPTILDYLSINKNPNFIGKSLFSKNFNNNNYIILEDLGRGPCDFKYQNIHLSVRSHVAKINFFLTPNTDPHKCKIESCFDLIKDANELRNLKDDKNFIKKHYNLKKVAINRFKSILNQIDFQQLSSVK